MKRTILLLLVAAASVSAQTPYISIHKGRDIDTAISNMRNERIFNVKTFGALGNGADDKVAVQAALNAASAIGGTVFIPAGGNFHVSDTLNVTGDNVTIEGNGGTITQTTAGKSIFRVRANGVKFRNLTVVGDTLGSFDAGDAHDIGIRFIDATGGTVENCTFSKLNYAIIAVYCDGIIIRDNYVDNAWNGILIGYNYQADQSLQNTGYLIEGNTIICRFGPLAGSRPISAPFATSYRIIGNKLRGGGMSFENLESITATDTSAKIFQGNDCDAACSIGGWGIVDGNVFDTRVAPSGRGPQSSYDEAVEVMSGNVSNNIIRHFRSGVAFSAMNTRVTGNVFESCGTPGVSLAAAVVHIQALYASPLSQTIIANNTFRGSGISDIALNWASAGVGDTLRDIIVNGNMSYDGGMSFLLMENCLNVLVVNNLIRNGNSATTGTGAYGVVESDTCSSYYAGNVFINTLTGGYGTYIAITGRSSIVGFNQFVGLRSSVPVYVYNAGVVLGPLKIDGSWYPMKSPADLSVGSGSAAGGIGIGYGVTPSSGKAIAYNKETNAEQILEEYSITFVPVLTEKYNAAGHIEFGTDNSGREIHFQTNGGAATFGGSLSAASIVGAIEGSFISRSFSSAARDAVYVPGTISTDSWQASWQPATEVGTPGGGRVWATAKTDSVIVRCDSVCSTQFTISRMK